MNNTSFRGAIEALVQVALPSWHPTRALYLGIACRMRDPAAGYDDYGSGGSLFFLVQKTCSYLTVWTATMDLPVPGSSIPDFGESSCYHDSCWIDTLEEASKYMYFDLADKVNPKKAPIDLEYTSSIRKSLVIDITTTKVDRDHVRYWVVDSHSVDEPSR